VSNEDRKEAMIQKSAKRHHLPDLSKLPKVLHSLPWGVIGPDTKFSDGDVLLVAVPVCRDSNAPDGDWYYSLECVTILCDEDYFGVRDSNGDSWGWEISDVDWLVKL
jgi:hypothetical protein